MSYFLSSSAYGTSTSTSTIRRPAVALVTGGKSGIGRALADKIADFPFIDQVVAVSRSIKPEDLKGGGPKLTALAADVSTAQGRETIVSKVKELCGESGQLRFLVHSAGVVDPIKPVLDVQPEELRRAMLINCEAPFFLTTSLYPLMADDDVAGRVLHVSSGAAHGAPPVGWSVYGITKAAFFQSFKVLEREFREAKEGKVVVGSFKPGVVDTTIQATIRESPAESMPIVQAFKNMKEKVTSVESDKARPPPKGALDSPQNVAHFAEFLLLGTDDVEFGNKDDGNEWDIRNEALFPRWIPKENLPN